MLTVVQTTDYDFHCPQESVDDTMATVELTLLHRMLATPHSDRGNVHPMNDVYLCLGPTRSTYTGMIEWYVYTTAVHILVNPRCACAGGLQKLVCLSVCRSVKSHLTSGASVYPENSITYSAGNGGQKIVGFSLRCGDPALPLLKTICMVGHFPAESVHAHCSIGIYHKVAPRVLHFSAFICSVALHTPSSCAYRLLVGAITMS